MEETFTKVVDLLYLAKQDEVEIVLNDGRLQLKVPENKSISENLLEEIRANKELLIDFLGNDSWKLKTVDNNYRITKTDTGSLPLHIPLSFSQERLWFIDQLEGSLQYHITAVLRLRGALDVNALEYALGEIVNRHEILRTVYGEEAGHAWQEIKPAHSWRMLKTKGQKYNENAGALKHYIATRSHMPFDLSKDDMLRAELIELHEKEHVLLVTMHHIASDAWSMPILVGEVVELYGSYTKGRQPRLSALPLQYTDFAIWQRSYLSGDILEHKLSYWKQKLAGITPLQLPADYPRPAELSTRGASAGFRIPSELAMSLRKLSQDHGATLYMTLLSAFKVLLYRYSGQEDICVGTSIAGRPQQELEGLIGFFVNTLALRSQVNGEMSFGQLLKEVRSTMLEAYAHQEVPFERVVDSVARERDSGRNPLFQVMLVLRNTPEVPQLKLGELELSGEPYEHTTVKFDLTFFITETSNGLHGSVLYSTDLYRQERMERMMGHFTELLNSIVSSPEKKIGLLRMISSTEEEELVNGFNLSHLQNPFDKTLIELFEDQVVQAPELVAIAFEGKELKYAELNHRSNQLAHYLRGKKVHSGSMVPLFMERGIEMIVAILGILKAGAAYVPIDTDFPTDRIQFMLDDTQATVALVSKADERFPAPDGMEVIVANGDWSFFNNEPSVNLLIPSSKDQLTYVIYTSGSTGRPKGVLVEQGNLLDYVAGLNERTNINSCSSYALVSTIATDLGNTVLYSWLVSGGTLHIFSKDTVSHVERLHAYFRRYRIDCLKIVPSHWKALSLDGEPLLPANLLVFGGEVLQLDTVKAIQKENTGCRIVNHYGPTETTIGKLLHEVNLQGEYEGTIPIGKPFSNTNVYVLSQDGSLCPIGVPGELYIGGSGVARGYLHNSELAGEKFIADPFRKAKGSKVYKTGDRVSYQADGNIIFLGRVDDQVKIRGYRVEPGEVSRVLERCPIVRQSVVISRDDAHGVKRLIGYVVPAGAFDREGIVAYLQEKLPDYMVPSVLVELEALPLTANGKVDRKSLPDPEAMAESRGYVAPETETEQKLAAIWQEVLEIEQVGLNDDFFELGGHSLLAVRLISAIRKAFKAELPISEVFDYPTVGQLAGRLKGEHTETGILPAIAPGKRPVRIPLSFSQERLWFIDRLEGSVQYHVPAVLRLTGKLDAQALGQSLEAIVRRHEVLRTVMKEEGGTAYQEILKEWPAVLQLVDRPADTNEGSLEKQIRELIAAPFNLSEDGMLRAHLIELKEDEHILEVTIHHIASDGWSRSILVSELVELYAGFTEGRAAKLPALPVQYADYAAWQQDYLQGTVLEEKLGYWKAQLGGVSPLELPTDHARPAIQGTKGALVHFTINKELLAGLQQLSQAHGATLYMTLLSAFQVLLHRYSGQEDICVGTGIAGRQHQELEGLIGFFVNTLAMRSQVAGEKTFTGLLEEVKATTLAAYAHQEVPFEKVVEAVSTSRDRSRNPVFQVMFILRNTPDVPELKLGEVALSRAGYQHSTSLFDLTLFITETPQGLQGSIEYNTDLYGPATMQRMADHLRNLLAAVVAGPEEQVSRLRLLGREEETLLVEGFNATAVPYPEDKTLTALFEEQAARTPEAVALVFEDAELSYGELNRQSNQLAHYLITHGVKRGTLVPVCIERGMRMIIGVLGILKAGAVYVPIDPEYPAERIGYMLNDTGARLIVSSKTSRNKLGATDSIDIIETDGADQEAIGAQPHTNPVIPTAPDRLVYVIYTSGSTGKPKGVCMPERGMINLLSWQQKQFSHSHRHVLQFASLTFDVSFQEIFSTLCFGSTLYLINESRRKDMSALLQDINRYRITHVFIPYIVLKSLVEFAGTLALEAVLPQEIIVAGEQLKLTDDIRELIEKRGIKLINQYGPTEAHVVSSYTLTETTNLPALPPIGKPIDNTRLYVLDAHQEVCPVGIGGELYIGGVQVAQGYLNRPELTAEKFLPDRFTAGGGRLYRTGDRARWLWDGTLEYLGRIDDQVKVRGHRIEPGEIESVLQESGLVSQGVVLAKEDSSGGRQLVGYVVAEGGFDKEGVMRYLQGKLPEYMVPALWVVLEKLPVTPNGKVDKRALPVVDINELVNKQYIVPRNYLEAKLAQIWQELLGLEQVGINDDFFKLGGHSLLAVRIVSVINKELQIELTIKELFLNSSIVELANHIQQQKDTDPLSAVNLKFLIQIKGGAGKLPLYIVSGGGGTVFKFKEFAGMLDANQPVFGLQQPTQVKDLEQFPLTIEGIAAKYVEEILIQNPQGPYALSGHCLGGTIAYEMTRQLEELGKKVELLALFDTQVVARRKRELPTPGNLYLIPAKIKSTVSKALFKLQFELFLFRNHTRQAILYKLKKIKLMMRNNTPTPEERDLDVFGKMSRAFQIATRNYEIKPYDGDLLVFYAKKHYYFMDRVNKVVYKELSYSPNIKNAWSKYARSVKIYEIDGEHSTIFHPMHATEFAKILQSHLDTASSSNSSVNKLIEKNPENKVRI